MYEAIWYDAAAAIASPRDCDEDEEEDDEDDEAWCWWELPLLLTRAAEMGDETMAGIGAEPVRAKGLLFEQARSSELSLQSSGWKRQRDVS